MSGFDQSDENLPLPEGETRGTSSSILFISDTEMYRRLGVGPRTGRIAISALERSGFPPKLPLWGNRRYWPAVRAFLDRHYGAAPYNRFRHQSGSDNLTSIQGQRTRAKLEGARPRLLGRSGDDSESSGA
jgi:hypothetical protein